MRCSAAGGGEDSGASPASRQKGKVDVRETDEASTSKGLRSTQPLPTRQPEEGNDREREEEDDDDIYDESGDEEEEEEDYSKPQMTGRLNRLVLELEKMETMDTQLEEGPLVASTDLEENSEIRSEPSSALERAEQVTQGTDLLVNDDWSVAPGTKFVPVDKYLALLVLYRNAEFELKRRSEIAPKTPSAQSSSPTASPNITKATSSTKSPNRSSTSTPKPLSPAVRDRKASGSKRIRRKTAGISSRVEKDEKDAIVEERRAQHHRIVSLKDQRRKEKDQARLAPLVDKTQIQRMNVLLEILNTERSYLSTLQLLIRAQIVLLENKVINESEAQALFANVEELFSLHQGIATTLDARLLDIGDESCWTASIGDIMLGLANQLKIYSAYADNQPKQHQTVDLCSGRKNFSSLLYSEVPEFPQRDLVTVHLNSFLIVPIQRMCKYPLLMRELIRCTSEDHPDMPKLQETLQCIQESTLGVNERKKDFERMCEIAETVEGLPRGFRLLSPNRNLVMEGPLFKISNGHTQERHFILFDDLILYGTRSLLRPGKIQFKGKILLDRVLIRPLKDTDATQHAFELVRIDQKKKKYVIFGRTADEKNEWVKEIQERTVQCRRRVSHAISQEATRTVVARVASTDPTCAAEQEDEFILENEAQTLALMDAHILKMKGLIDSVPQDDLEEHLNIISTLEQASKELREQMGRQ